MDLTIVIPAYNEEQRITTTLTQYLEFFRTTKLKFELLVIPNGCKDKTKEITRNLAKTNPEITYKNFEKPIGKGGAVLEGMKLAKGNLIAYTDADNATAPKTLYELITKIEGFDCIMGSRWDSFFKLNPKIKVKQPLARKLASRGFNLIVRSYLNLQYPDTQAGAKVFKREALQKILPNLQTTGWAFDVSILYKLKKQHYKIKAVPIEWSDDPNSKLRLKRAIPNMLKTVIKLRFEK